MDLYRRQAVAFRHGSSLGSVHLSASKAGTWVVVLVVAFSLVVVAWLIFGRVARSEPARGQLVPSSGLLPVVAPRTGTLVRVLVAEGQTVRAGQPLFEISSERSVQSEPGEGLGGVLKTELEKQRRSLQDDLIWVNSAERGYRDQAQESAEYLADQLSLVERQYALKQREARSSQSLLERVRKLEPGMLTAMQLQQYESAALMAQRDLAQLQQQRIEARRKHLLAVRQVQAAPVDLIGQRNRIERELSGVAQSLARNAADTTQQIPAPRDGLVSVVSVHPGQAVQDGMRVLALIPAGAILEAELWAPSRGIGQVAPGGKVALRYEAFPFQTFGHHQGRIRAISESALMPDEILALSGIKVQEPSYRITVALDEQAPRHAGRALHLRPNMAVDAQLLLEQRPLYRLLLPDRAAPAMARN
ncbi:HlyD family secretion protein [Lysobacter soli]|uniref:HlyD family secretion protein n=1 Tax=Lysobacter soli TaxID=453783 RepID=UPI0024109E81|nr:HlyD family efflux transporter periplasmic adaptor subunit [Lysobacter soli]MDG2517330.1 HlyD family efflux transporter periplasmic adaptor subunit [Lysobacter soli]